MADVVGMDAEAADSYFIDSEFATTNEDIGDLSDDAFVDAMPDESIGT